jgi:hypothetical protein
VARQQQLGKAFELATDRLLCSLLALLSGMVATLTVDPRLFGKDAAWAVVVQSVRTLLDAFLANLQAQDAAKLKAARAAAKRKARGQASEEPPPSPWPTQAAAAATLQEQATGQLVLGLVRVATAVVSGARQVGAQAKERQFADKLLGGKSLPGGTASSASSAAAAAAAALPAAAAVRGGLARKVCTPALAAPLLATLEAVHLRGAQPHLGGYGALGPMACKALLEACEGLIKLLDPESANLALAGEAEAAAVAETAKDGGGGEGGGEGGSAPASAVERVAESAAEQPLEPKALFAKFVQALNACPAIEASLNRRRFAFAEVLENAAALTNPKPPGVSALGVPSIAAAAKAPKGAMLITWDQVRNTPCN